MDLSPGKKFRDALAVEKPLQIIGVINAYSALLAKSVGFKALYLSGAGVANQSYGLPDIGLTSIDNLFEDARRITAIVDLPLIVDIDTGWDNPILIERCVKSMRQAGVAGIQIEDQDIRKKCGHLPEKVVVPIRQMEDRIEAAATGKGDSDFIIIARSDAYASEGFDRLVQRCKTYLKAGADMTFPEALPSIEEFRDFKREVKAPCLANLTEFGLTPLVNIKKLEAAGIDMALYPLSACRAMNNAALTVMQNIRTHGSQLACLEMMQTREELYHYLDYEKYKKLEEKWYSQD